MRRTGVIGGVVRAATSARMVARTRRRFGVVVGVVIALGGLMPTAAADENGDDRDAWDEQHWYVLSMNGERAGWSRRAWRTDDDGWTESVTEVFMRLERMGSSITLTTLDWTEENERGEVVRTAYVTRQNEMTTRETFTFDYDAGTIDVAIDRGAGGVAERTIEMPGGAWLSPTEVRELLATRLRAGAERVSCASLVTRDGAARVIELAFEREGETTVRLGDEEIEGVLGTMTSSETPGVRIETVLDADGVTLRTDGRIGVLRISERIAEAEEALGAFTAPEFMVSTFVAPDGEEIARPRELRRALYRLSVREGSLPALPTAGAQRMMPIGDAEAAWVFVDAEAGAAAPAEVTPAERAALLEASVIADANDAAIGELVEEALADVPAKATDATRAETLRAFVFEYVEGKNLDSAYASASEVARLREGDCTEHAVLLVAMLRAAGVPARGVNGLIFADELGGVDEAGVRRGAFGYHMWAQALAAGDDGVVRWIDLDPSWPQGMDATRIATSLSGLRDGEDETALLAVARLVGNLEIEVIATGEAAADAAAERGVMAESVDEPAPAGGGGR